ncbi:50S ribosomal protein L3 [Candidatus Woesearchaeota archaeon]|nr:50S ribosomal protein L3 [Candidatus Woesearchaeota archaeon]
MGKAHKPRSGSLQFWPRKRAKRAYARVQSWPEAKEAKPIGFAGYKVGMAHVMFTDNRANSMTKGQDISMPVTIVECPALKVASVIFYKKTNIGLKISSSVFASKLDKELSRKIILPKTAKKKIEDFKPEEYGDIRILVYTQPKLTTIGKKKPEVFELALGGKIEEKYAWAKENLGKEINIADVFAEGQHIDIRAVTKGKGLAGPMKRFGISRTSHKSEKGVRTPANLGAWTGARQWRVAKAGQLGYQQRTELNKWILKMSSNPEELKNKSGFKRYGVVKNPYVLIKGSVAGATKRLVTLTQSIRPDKKLPSEAPSINNIIK